MVGGVIGNLHKTVIRLMLRNLVKIFVFKFGAVKMFVEALLVFSRKIVS